MDINEATAKAIQAERAIAEKTVRQLAEESAIPLTSLMRVLKGTREIKINQVAQIAEALDIYPHEIIEHAENIMTRTAPEQPTRDWFDKAAYEDSDPTEDEIFRQEHPDDESL